MHTPRWAGLVRPQSEQACLGFAAAPTPATETIADQSSHVTPSPPRVHLSYLVGLRGVFGLYIVLSHTVWMIWPEHVRPAGVFSDLFVAPLMYGHYIVDGFIVLSGYSLMLAVTRHGGVIKGGVWKFLGRRARRILPPYYAALAVCGLLIRLLIGHKTGSLWDISIPITGGGLVSHLFMLQGWGEHWQGQIDYPLWSMAVEWWNYFLFPLLVLSWRRLGGEGTTLAFVAASLLLVYITPKALRFGLSPQFIGLFAIGAYAAQVSSSRAHCSSWRSLLLRGVVLTAMFVPVYLFVRLSLLPHLPLLYAPRTALDTIFGLWMGLFFYACTRPGFVLTRALAWRPLVGVGTFAYSLYLLHAPLLQIIWQYSLRPLHLGAETTFALLALTGLPIIVGASYLFSLVFERPFMKDRSRETPAEVARDAALSPAP